MDSAHVQRRRHVRHRLEAPVFVRSAVSSARSGARGHCLNLSESGAGLVVAGPWQPGQVLQLELVLPRGEEPLLVIARMVHRSRLYCGLEFLGMTESATLALRSAWSGSDTETTPGRQQTRKEPLDPLALL